VAVSSIAAPEVEKLSVQFPGQSIPVHVTLPPLPGLIDIFKVVAPAPPNDRMSVGVSRALEGMESEADFDPREVGEKSISSVQFPDGVIVLPEQLSLWMLNSPWLVPDNVIVPTSKSTLPVLERVML
jgi:hypothetical protein